MRYRQTVHPAFGAAAILLDIENGHVIDDYDLKQGIFTVKPDGTYNETNDKYVWMVFEGHMRHTNLTTGDVTDRHPGYCSLGIFDQPGQIKVDVLADTKMLCVPPHLRNGIPLENISAWSLKAGESVAIPQGTKLFLGAGQIDVQGTSVAGPKQVRFASGGKKVTAVTDAYGLIFT